MIGGVATVAATPSAIGYAAAAKVASGSGIEHLGSSIGTNGQAVS